MKITIQSTFANTAIVGNVTYRMVGTYGLGIGFGLFLFTSPVFRWNIPALIAYVALASIIVGHTPTKRTVLLNLWGLLVKKPIRMVVSELASLNTLGHGIRNVEFPDDLEVPAFKMNTGHYALVWTVTSGLNRWSKPEEYERQKTSVKSLFNTLEGGESVEFVTKQDADTGMLQLEKSLDEVENFEGDDLKALSDRRRLLLHRVATQDVGRSVQQYAILKVKPKNVNRCVKALKKCSRIIRPASNPADILLSTMGLEAGTEQND